MREMIVYHVISLKYCSTDELTKYQPPLCHYSLDTIKIYTTSPTCSTEHLITLFPKKTTLIELL